MIRSPRPHAMGIEARGRGRFFGCHIHRQIQQCAQCSGSEAKRQTHASAQLRVCIHGWASIRHIRIHGWAWPDGGVGAWLARVLQLRPSFPLRRTMSLRVCAIAADIPTRVV